MASSFIFLILAFISFSLAGKNNNTKQVDYCNIKSCPNPKNHILCGKPVDKVKCNGQVVKVSEEDQKKLIEAFNNVRTTVSNLRFKLLNEKNPPKLQPMVWDDDLAKSAQAVANTCKWQYGGCVNDPRFIVIETSGHMRLTPKNTFENIQADIQGWFNGETNSVMRQGHFKNYFELVKHYEFSFEGPLFACAGIVQDKSNDGQFICHFSPPPYK